MQILHGHYILSVGFCAEAKKGHFAYFRTLQIPPSTPLHLLFPVLDTGSGDVIQTRPTLISASSAFQKKKGPIESGLCQSSMPKYNLNYRKTWRFSRAEHLMEIQLARVNQARVWNLLSRLIFVMHGSTLINLGF